MITGMAGPGWTLSPGDVGTFDAPEAIRLIEAGFALPHPQDPPERAVKTPAAEKRGKK